MTTVLQLILDKKLERILISKYNDKTQTNFRRLSANNMNVDILFIENQVVNQKPGFLKKIPTIDVIYTTAIILDKLELAQEEGNLAVVYNISDITNGTIPFPFEDITIEEFYHILQGIKKELGLET